MFPSSSPLFLFTRSRCPFHLTFVSCFIPFIFYASSVTHSNGLYEPQLICPFSQMTATRKLCDTRISATMYWPNRCVQMCIIKSSLLLVVGRAIVLYFIANNLPFFFSSLFVPWEWGRERESVYKWAHTACKQYRRMKIAINSHKKRNNDFYVL